MGLGRLLGHPARRGRLGDLLGRTLMGWIEKLANWIGWPALILVPLGILLAWILLLRAVLG
jgi:hypothetical protein